MNTPATPKPTAAVLHPLDALTGGALSAPTSGERAARLREWLATEPSLEHMTEVFKDLSQRDRGAAKALKEKLDEHKRLKSQEQIAAGWAQKAQTLLAQSRLNLGDALAWHRDAARAGAPLSREPLAGLKQALSERINAIEDLQHRVQIEREAAVLLAQRIEVLSTKSWREATQQAGTLKADVAQWQLQVAALFAEPQWASLEPKFPSMLETARVQLQVVWEAFDAALAQAAAADADNAAPLPAVPVWAEELRVARGEPAAAQAMQDGQAAKAAQERRAKAQAELERALATLEKELSEGRGKATPKAAADVRALMKSHGRLIGPDLETKVHAVLTQAGELEDWQRWRADQLRQELVQKAESLLQGPEDQRLGGRRMQETLRQLREQWKVTDQGGSANHALWKRFDAACNEAYKVVESWLTQLRQQAETHKAQRLAIINDLKAWTAAHSSSTDWKTLARDLYAFAERWRAAGHLSEKAFAELQPIWKETMQIAHAGLEAAQAQSIARRQAMIEEAVALGAAPQLRIDAVKALQQRWQAEAQSVPLERKYEQKLWDAFRKPIDEAFARKSSEREDQAKALNAHDQRALEAARALDVASASHDAMRIRAAMAELEAALRGSNTDTSSEALHTQTPVPADSATEPSASSAAAPKKLVAVRGDDRPGMRRTEPAARDERRGRDPREGRGSRSDNPGFERHGREPRGPRLGDAAFRAQRSALEHAELALRKLAAQASGEVLVQLFNAWQQRDAMQLPTAQALGSKVNGATRIAWVHSLQQAVAAAPVEALLRLEMAAEVPTPADQLGARRALQLQLLTRKNEAPPAQTWGHDVAQVLASPFHDDAARRLQAVLKVLLRL